MHTGSAQRDLVCSIVGGFHAVYDYYGFGASESVYAGALDHELADRGHEITRELSVAVSYKGRHVAWQRVYVVVDRSVIVEVKATESLLPAIRARLADYLAASSFDVAVLLHFGPTPHFELFTHHRTSPMLLTSSPASHLALDSAGLPSVGSAQADARSACFDRSAIP